MPERATDLLVFIPAWNEEQSLPAVLSELAEGLPDANILVVDDGSTDRTGDVARAGGAEVVRFEQNRGLGEGIAAGYRHALAGGYAICGRVDADGQHPVAELARLITEVRGAAVTSPSARGTRRARAMSRTATAWRAGAGSARR